MDRTLRSSLSELLRIEPVEVNIPPPPGVPSDISDDSVKTATICRYCGIDLVIECPCEEPSCHLRTHLIQCLSCNPEPAFEMVRKTGIKVCDRVLRRLLLESNPTP
jgi:hypothetical protein